MSEFGDISKMKVPELKAALKDRGLPVSGAKQVKKRERNVSYSFKLHNRLVLYVLADVVIDAKSTEH